MSDLKTIINDPDFEGLSLDGTWMELDPHSGGKLQLLSGIFIPIRAVNDLQPRSSSQLEAPSNLLLENKPESRPMHEHVAVECSALLCVVDPPLTISSKVLMVNSSS